MKPFPRAIACFALFAGLLLDTASAQNQIQDKPFALTLEPSDTVIVVASGAVKQISLTNFKTSLSFQPLDAELTALGGLVSATDRIPYFNGSGSAALATFTSAGRNMVAAANITAQRLILGITNVEDVELSTWAGSANLAQVGTVTSGTWHATPLDLATYSIGLLPTASFPGAGFNGANQLIKMNGSGQYPAGDGSLITGLSSGFSNPMTTAGDMMYGGVAGAATRVAGPIAANDYVWSSHGTGSVAGVPAWTALSFYFTQAGTSFGSSTSPGSFSTLSAVGAVTLSPSSGNVTLSPATGNVVMTTTGSASVQVTPNGNLNLAPVAGSITGTTTGAGTITLTSAGLGTLTNFKLNGNTFTTGTGTLTLATSKTLTASNTLTLAGTDGSTLNVGGGGTLGTAAYTAASAYQAAGVFSYLSVASASTVTLAVDAHENIREITALAAPITVANPTGTMLPGMKLTIFFSQNGTGGYATTFGSEFHFGTDVTTAMIPTTASASYAMHFIRNPANTYWFPVGIVRGF